MKNYIQPGNIITVTAPTGGVTSGTGLLVGNLFGIPRRTRWKAQTLKWSQQAYSICRKP